MSVLVTGGTGEVGASTARKFVDEGYSVICYDIAPRKVDFLNEVSSKVRLEFGDIRDLSRILDLIEKFNVEGIIHTAAWLKDLNQFPDWSFKVDVDGTATVLEAARLKNLKVVSMSSASVYGAKFSPDLKPIKEDESFSSWGSGSSVTYAVHKYMLELLTTKYHDAHNLDAVVIRGSCIYGPNQQVAIPPIPFFISKALAREPYEMIGANNTLDLTYVRDIAEGIFLAYSVRPIKHYIFNISGGRSYSLSELADTVMKTIPGSQIKVHPGIWAPMERFLPRNTLDLTRAQEELGYRPRYSLDKGVKEFVDWIGKNPSYTLPLPLAA
ncbi:MAG: NAD(P)-dependent oxidoreductase [Candidatus Bathyarchaeia archaeon]|jgi:nucleoside-diphosphate-sugar epimerase